MQSCAVINFMLFNVSIKYKNVHVFIESLILLGNQTI